MRRFIAALTLMILMFTAAGAPAEEFPEGEAPEEEILEEEVLEEEIQEEEVQKKDVQEENAQPSDYLMGAEPEPSEITPAYRSEEHP